MAKDVPLLIIQNSKKYWEGNIILNKDSTIPISPNKVYLLIL